MDGSTWRGCLSFWLGLGEGDNPILFEHMYATTGNLSLVSCLGVLMVIQFLADCNSAKSDLYSTAASVSGFRFQISDVRCPFAIPNFFPANKYSFILR